MIHTATRYNDSKSGMEEICRKCSRYIVAFAIALLVIWNGPVHADQPLMTLSVESSVVPWQNEFILTLTIYLPADVELPEVTIDGLDQFELRSTGRNLLQVPRGKTQKWILTYTLTAIQDGSFKVGPAALSWNDRRYYSNTLFIKVNAPLRRESSKPKEPVPEEAATPKETAKPDETKVTPPVVLSAAEIGEKILVRMEARPERPFRSAGVVVTLDLLAQLPVENLRFLDDPNFPGFLKYDFPFTAHPKADKVKHNGEYYATYELLRFLIFPLSDGEITIPPVRCEMKVRVPSGAYTAADPIYELERVTNTLKLQVQPVSDAVVGNFVLSNEILEDAPQSKVVRLSLEGTGQLSTFDFPEIAGSGFQVRPTGGFIQAAIEGESLQSRKVLDLQVLPDNNTTSIVLPEINIWQFHPGTRHRSMLKLPALPLQFSPPAPVVKPPVPLPDMTDSFGPFLPWFPAITALLFLPFHFRPVRRNKTVRLAYLFKRKNERLNISRTAAQKLYQRVTAVISEQDGDGVSLTETLKRHLPQEDWLAIDRTFRKLEWIAFSPFRNESLTYSQMRQICEQMERRWMR